MQIDLKNESEFSFAALPGREIAKKYGISKFVGFVLIKLNTVFGPVYVLEDRSSDTGFHGRVGLYGGELRGMRK